MLKLFSLKQKKQSAQEQTENKTSSNKTTAAELRLQKDISELDTGKTLSVYFPDKNNIVEFIVYCKPDEGIYKYGCFAFRFKIPPTYPHDPPKVKCETKVFHPNIDEEGNVCLNILREDWKPILSLNAILYGLQYLFLEPNPDDPLNKEAANLYRDNKAAFYAQVQRSMRESGAYYSR
ncbi:ubiquitin-conjugating enzyme E2 [Galdieria sulphuraria]|uniref:Ubiquitin-conjugating enzyme E2 n=1 Tax=Galdieria sulphuraria TaxID=130081 RepID=M2VUY9_GALSU|nr:ubiquitin-conjugating enzyme E2 [Galdieria sulphuraria]EME27021.1 ubiquitin-conjugating enzyme E2 [Galdieria sulphuraria]|eukprot:XP_005703541.1 ubiquitin-conjugating enzyme E2 [Galdieria sulphuraria]